MYLCVYGVQTQTINPVGNYVYKTYRKGKGGFENHLEITKAARGKFHVSFEGVYFYMAGKDETFHEGSGEGDGQLNGNVLTATLDDGAGGSCRLTLTFNETLVINEYTVMAKTGRICQLNSSPEGLYRKEVTKKKASGPNEIRQAANGDHLRELCSGRIGVLSRLGLHSEQLLQLQP